MGKWWEIGLRIFSIAVGLFTAWLLDATNPGVYFLAYMSAAIYLNQKY